MVQYVSLSGGILKTIVAFANTFGGVIVIGVEDRTKKISGLIHLLCILLGSRVEVGTSE